MLENEITPRIFIAATRQNDGKTTTSLGLVAALRKRFKKVGYIKPVGQRYVDVSGLKIDEDTVLINDTYNPGLPLEAMSPIAVEPTFTRDYLDKGDPAELRARVEKAFNRAAWEQEFVVIEGSGHAGVGSVFDMSNAHTASILKSKAIIVSRGGVGGPIDEIALNLALFEKYKVPVIGVVLNKVLPSRIADLRPYAEKGLAKLGLPLLGIVPFNGELRKPTMNQICQELGGRFIAGEKGKRRRVSSVHIATMTSKNAEIFFDPNSLIIVAGDREDIVLSVLSANQESRQIAGVVLTHGLEPQPDILRIMQAHNVPFIAVQQEAYEVASKINDMTVKTEPGDSDKILLIQQLIEQNIDIDAIIAASWMK
ncbi:MAG: AAA family ATPase [Verrucomicrobiales bacterium]|jgi:BioD-like phosphotransacetylase family protein|nr:AAA family ATPase [Verrucomicrobiales bacterium]